MLVIDLGVPYGRRRAEEIQVDPHFGEGGLHHFCRRRHIRENGYVPNIKGETESIVSSGESRCVQRLIDRVDVALKQVIELNARVLRPRWTLGEERVRGRSKSVNRKLRDRFPIDRGENE